MAVIGNFQELEAGGFAGEVRTLTLILKGVRFRPNSSAGPDYIVSAGPVDVGAAWVGSTVEGRRRLRVELDDLSFCDTVHAALEESQGGWQLTWARRQPAGG